MNEPRRRGPIARIAIGLWDTVNFTRRLVFNLLFLALLLMLLAVMFGGGVRLAPVFSFAASKSPTHSPHAVDSR